ncbi:hypothetical protein BDR07DRAFT_1376884 [Suillus spraguei]|nr:hypothetical protein BDR07DRAFT_1376884 [Suillus spraguei]
MPVSRSLFKWCFCEECIETGDRAEDGMPKGYSLQNVLWLHIYNAPNIPKQNVLLLALPARTPSRIYDLEQLTLLDHFVACELRVAISGDVSQKNIHRPTVKALMVLDNIEFRVQWCFRLLLAAVESVKRKADIVVTRKRAIMLEIDGLEAQFNSQKPPEMDLCAAVEFDTSKS